MDEPTVDAYLRRIGMPAAAGEADAATLRELQERHLMSVPFENLDFHLGVTIDLGRATVDKVVTRRRGGTCRELNGSAFPNLLRALGYPITLLASRVYTGHELGVVLGHTVIRVDAPEPWLVDIGFGRGSRYPLRLDLRTEQPDPHGTFVLVETSQGDLDLLRDGKPVYRIETRPRELDDFLPVLWWFQTSPNSPFTRHLFCSLVTATGRVTLSGDVLVRTEHGHQVKSTLTNDREIRNAYREHFGITLDRLPPIPVAATGDRRPVP